MIPGIRRAGAVAALLSAALVPSALAQEPAPTRPAAPRDSNRPVRSPGNAEWASDAQDAQAKAAAQGKLVYYEFDSPNCSACQRMQGLLYPALDFEALLIGMVPVKLMLTSNAAAPLAERYKITDVPSVLITTAEGRLVFLMQGFTNAPDFYRHVHADLDRYRKFVKKLDGQTIETLSAEEAYATGRELYARSDPAAALPRLKRAAVAPNPKPGVRENALEGLAEVELQLSHFGPSREAIDKLIATTKNADQKERAELFRAQLPLAEKKPAEALALYKKFVKDHPASPYRERVEGFIARLEASAPPP
jgi:tetratricopeptide (TPR) repeat protein